MPEEINRILTDRISTLLFAPTTIAVDHLKQEGRSPDQIFQVGDVMYDALLFYKQKAEQKSTILESLGLKSKQYILATIHRAENTDSLIRLTTIFNALQEVSKTISVVLPLHPRTQKVITEQNVSITSDSFQLIDPVGYLDMVMLEQHSCLICTDSGGLQKEAFFHQVPCLTLRDETEWQELIDLGWNELVSPTASKDFICQKILSHINQRGCSNVYPYGKGQSAKAIVNILASKK